MISIQKKEDALQSKYGSFFRIYNLMPAKKALFNMKNFLPD